MSNTISNTDDVIDTRDLIARIEELDAIHDQLFDNANNSDFSSSNRKKAEKAFEEWQVKEDGECSERATLKAFEEEIEGYCPDYRHGATLIRDSYFESYMDEMLEDCGDIPKDLPSYLKITVDYDALQSDYASADLDGVTFWFR